MTKKKDKDKGIGASTVRAYRISDETHEKLKELAERDDRKLGSKLTMLINTAHKMAFPPSEQ